MVGHCLDPRGYTVNALLATINYSQSDIVAPTFRLSNPLDRPYCGISDEDIQKFYPEYWQRTVKAGVDVYRSGVNDCDDFSFRFVQFIKDLHMRDNKTPLICVAISLVHVAVVVFHSETEWTHYEAQLPKIQLSKINQVIRLERV